MQGAHKKESGGNQESWGRVGNWYMYPRAYLLFSEVVQLYKEVEVSNVTVRLISPMKLDSAGKAIDYAVMNITAVSFSL